MNTRQKQMHKLKIKITAGGTEDVPPTFYPPPAYTSACVPTHVECTGSAGLNEIKRMGCARPPTSKQGDFSWKAI